MRKKWGNRKSVRYVIIGNSAAGISASEVIRNLDKNGEISIISKENFPAYSPMLITYYLKKKIKWNEMFIRENDFYKNNHLKMYFGKKVVEVKETQKKVILENGEEIIYDRLLIASGASPYFPDIPGLKKCKKALGLRTLEDAKNISSLATKKRRVVVMGGGLVSLQVTNALILRGLETTLLVSSSQILSRNLDHRGASILQDALIEKGVKIYFNTSPNKIIESKNELEIVLDSGNSLETDFIVVGKGVRPNIDFLSKSSIKIDYGILVNQYMQSNFIDVFAAGDVAQVYDFLYQKNQINAIWPNAVLQGKLAGYNMVNNSRRKAGDQFIGMNITEIAGNRICSIGQTINNEDKVKEIFRIDTKKKIYRKFLIKNGNIIGAVLINKIEDAGIINTMIRKQINLEKIKTNLLIDNHSSITSVIVK